jgi:hypothetical protein
MSEQPFTKANVDQVLDRFYRCSDGVIRRVELDFKSDRESSTATIVCSVRDSDAAAQWVNLICRVRGLSEFSFSEGRTSYRVLSDGLVIGWFEDLIFLDFGPYTVEPDSVEDFRRSGCYFAGKSATWEVVPYSE